MCPVSEYDKGADNEDWSFEGKDELYSSLEESSDSRAVEIPTL